MSFFLLRASHTNHVAKSGEQFFQQIRAVTPLPHTFDGLPIQCMGGVCGDPLTLIAVSCESRSMVMEMEEHPPSWRKPASLPIVRCERLLSHLGAWLAYGTAWWEWPVRSGGLL